MTDSRAHAARGAIAGVDCILWLLLPGAAAFFAVGGGGEHHPFADGTLTVTIAIFAASLAALVGLARWSLGTGSEGEGFLVETIIIDFLLTLITFWLACLVLPAVSGEFSPGEETGQGYWLWNFLAPIPYIFSLITNFVRWRNSRRPTRWGANATTVKLGIGLVCAILAVVITAVVLDN